MNLATAYPSDAHLAYWNRALRLDRAGNRIEILDDYRLSPPAKVITLTLMTPCKVQVSTAGEILLSMTSGGQVRVGYDASVLHPAVEEIPIGDAELRESWGERLYRILLRADAPPLQAKLSLRISQ